MLSEEFIEEMAELSRHHKANKKNIKDAIRQLIREGNPGNEIARMFALNISRISQIKNYEMD